MGGRREIMINEKLALYIYPIPQGTAYGYEELSSPTKVRELFDYCQILEGVISKKGWEFLINTYGYETLYSMDKESEWHDCSSLEEYISWIEYEMESSPKTL